MTDNNIADRSETNSAAKSTNGVVFAILGWFFFVVSFVFVPILFGAGCFIMGYLLRKKAKQDVHGTVMMVMGVVGAIIGALIGAVVTSMNLYP